MITQPDFFKDYLRNLHSIVEEDMFPQLVIKALKEEKTHFQEILKKEHEKFVRTMYAHFGIISLPEVNHISFDYMAKRRYREASALCAPGERKIWLNKEIFENGTNEYLWGLAHESSHTMHYLRQPEFYPEERDKKLEVLDTNSRFNYELYFYYIREFTADLGMRIFMTLNETDNIPDSLRDKEDPLYQWYQSVKKTDAITRLIKLNNISTTHLFDLINGKPLKEDRNSIVKNLITDQIMTL